MPLFSRSPDRPSPRDEERAGTAIADYLAVSRSPLRLTEPEWFDLAERRAWERLRAAVGVDVGGRVDRQPSGGGGGGDPGGR